MYEKLNKFLIIAFSLLLRYLYYHTESYEKFASRFHIQRGNCPLTSWEALTQFEGNIRGGVDFTLELFELNKHKRPYLTFYDLWG